MTFRPSDDSRPTDALFAALLEGDYDAEAPWQAVSALRLRGTQEVFVLAAEYCRSPNPRARARGLDVLGQLGAGKPDAERPYLAQCVSIAIESLKDSEAMVVHSAAWALAHLATDDAVGALLQLKQHPDPDVRHAVAMGVAATSGPQAVAALLELTVDPDDNVRDWATFGLGSQSSEDSRQIREALRRRLQDPYEPARSEAVWGLALRKDPAGLRLLLERLESEEPQQGDVYTAQEILDLAEGAAFEDLCAGLRKLLE